MASVLRSERGHTMGKLSRAKGKRGEREVVALARQAGLAAERTWETAQSANSAQRACDVRIGPHRCQVKLRRTGFGPLYAALVDVDFAFVRTDNREWLAVLPADRLLALLKVAEDAPCRK